ncbi:hypothetical protein Y601_3448 [Burkholderia pseudomallei MSHR640]|nr:hypothetical protein Y601_3448 [Burkholderia pseudomallei MSHR640]
MRATGKQPGARPGCLCRNVEFDQSPAKCERFGLRAAEVESDVGDSWAHQSRRDIPKQSRQVVVNGSGDRSRRNRIVARRVTVCCMVVTRRHGIATNGLVVVTRRDGHDCCRSHVGRIRDCRDDWLSHGTSHRGCWRHLARHDR